MTIQRLILIVTAACALAACGQKPESVAPVATLDAAAVNSSSVDAATSAAEDRIARDQRRNADVHAMAAKLADDPGLLAKQTEVCGAAPATNEPAPLVVPCMAQAEAHEILTQRSAQASGGVKNTGSL